MTLLSGRGEDAGSRLLTRETAQVRVADHPSESGRWRVFLALAFSP